MNVIRGIVWAVDQPGLAIELVKWRIRLRLAAFGERTMERSFHEMVNRSTASWGDSLYGRFVKWVSPFSPFTGYKRRRLRRLLFTIRYPRTVWMTTFGYAVAENIRKWLGITPGRYQSLSWPDRLKAEWLDSHTEWSDDQTGESELFGQWACLFDIVAPWSRDAEEWLLVLDSQGFVTITNEDAAREFDEIAANYNRWQVFEEVDAMYPDMDPDPLTVNE